MGIYGYLQVLLCFTKPEMLSALPSSCQLGHGGEHQAAMPALPWTALHTPRTALHSPRTALHCPARNKQRPACSGTPTAHSSRGRTGKGAWDWECLTIPCALVQVCSQPCPELSRSAWGAAVAPSPSLPCCSHLHPGPTSPISIMAPLPPPMLSTLGKLQKLNPNIIPNCQYSTAANES